MISVPIRIHFFGLNPDRRVIALAEACGVGSCGRTEGADARRFERLHTEARERWVAVSEESEADVSVYAHSYRGGEEAHTGALRAQKLGRPCVFYHADDDTTPLSPPYGVVYRDSLLASTRAPHERAHPAFADDLLRETGGMRVLPKRPRPSVGFCGFVGTAWGRAVYRVQGRRRKVLGLSLRARALAALERSPDVTPNFIRRTQFWGGAISRFRGPDPDAKRRVREEYLDNLAGSDYVLCIRGAGNFSYRFYETLAMGRVPLFVNTDCRLPFDDEIDWRRHVVWVEQEELPRIGERLLRFHAALSADDYEQLQHGNRRLWEDFLRPTECYQRVLERAIEEHRSTAQ